MGNLFSRREREVIAADLLFQKTGYYFPPDPSYPFQIGDYGTIHQKTGKFKKLGALAYSDDLIRDRIRHEGLYPDGEGRIFTFENDLVDGNRKTTFDATGSLTMDSRKMWHLDAQTQYVIMCIAGSRVRTWDLDITRNSDLYRRISASLPSNGPKIQDIVVVTGTFTGSTFAWLVADGKSAKAGLASCTFRDRDSDDQNGRGKTGWEVSNNIGKWSKQGYKPDGQMFTPLVQLRSFAGHSNPRQFARLFEEGDAPLSRPSTNIPDAQSYSGPPLPPPPPRPPHQLPSLPKPFDAINRTSAPSPMPSNDTTRHFVAPETNLQQRPEIGSRTHRDDFAQQESTRNLPLAHRGPPGVDVDSMASNTSLPSQSVVPAPINASTSTPATSGDHTKSASPVPIFPTCPPPGPFNSGIPASDKTSVMPIREPHEKEVIVRLSSQERPLQLSSNSGTSAQGNTISSSPREELSNPPSKTTGPSSAVKISPTYVPQPLTTLMPPPREGQQDVTKTAQNTHRETTAPSSCEDSIRRPGTDEHDHSQTPMSASAAVPAANTPSQFSPQTSHRPAQRDGVVSTTLTTNNGLSGSALPSTTRSLKSTADVSQRVGSSTADSISEVKPSGLPAQLKGSTNALPEVHGADSSPESMRKVTATLGRGGHPKIEPEEQRQSSSSATTPSPLGLENLPIPAKPNASGPQTLPRHSLGRFETSDSD